METAVAVNQLGRKFGDITAVDDLTFHVGSGELVGALALSNRILGFTNAPSLWQRVICLCLDAVVDLDPLRKRKDRLAQAKDEDFKGVDR